MMQGVGVCCRCLNRKIELAGEDRQIGNKLRFPRSRNVVVDAIVKVLLAFAEASLLIIHSGTIHYTWTSKIS